ncbi:hypothetical protein BC828DRAFT_404666 [Blastocladiella britannica]|nr:hypothetical protein BC828DRAFT_404666 [Blastocladiella britannica]
MKAFKGSFSKLSNQRASSVGPEEGLNPNSRSKSNVSLHERLGNQPPATADYSMRARIAIRVAQFVLAIMQLAVLQRLQSTFIMQRDLGSPYAAAIWISYLTFPVTLALVGIHYHPDVTKGKWKPSRPLGIDLAGSFISMMLYIGVFLALAINSGAGGGSQGSCPPGAQYGQCDNLNISILCCFIQVPLFGYMVFRSGRDIWKRRRPDDELISIAQLSRFRR